MKNIVNFLILPIFLSFAFSINFLFSKSAYCNPLNSSSYTKNYQSSLIYEDFHNILIERILKKDMDMDIDLKNLLGNLLKFGNSNKKYHVFRF